VKFISFSIKEYRQRFPIEKSYVTLCRQIIYVFFPLTVDVIDHQNPPDSVGDQNEGQCCIPKCLKVLLDRMIKHCQLINVIFLVLYMITVIVFMSVLWSFWYIL